MFQTWHPAKIRHARQPRSLLPLKRKQPGDCLINFFNCFDMHLYIHNGGDVSFYYVMSMSFPMLYLNFHLIALDLHDSIDFLPPLPKPTYKYLFYLP